MRGWGVSFVLNSSFSIAKVNITHNHSSPPPLPPPPPLIPPQGTTFPGTGVEVRQDAGDPKKVRVLMVAHSKLGGWLPQRLINKHIGAALADIMSNYAPGKCPDVGMRE